MESPLETDGVPFLKAEFHEWGEGQIRTLSRVHITTATTTTGV